MTTQPAKAQVDLATVAAMAAIVFLGSTLLHEAGGHGGACIATGGRIVAIGAFYVDCAAPNAISSQIVSAAGSTINLLAALLAGIAFRVSTSAAARIFWWLAFTVNGLVWAGYFLFSGVTGIGDWGEQGVLAGVSDGGLSRIGLAVLGAAAYFMIAWISARAIGAFVDQRTARSIAWIAYFTGGIVCVLVGLLNPLGIFILIASAAASSFGGASGLLWLPSLAPKNTASGFALPRSWPWLVASVLVIATYAAVLGPTLTF